MMPSRSAILLVLSLGGAACAPRNDGRIAASDSVALQDRAVRIAQRLTDSSTGAARAVPVARWVLPAQLNEVSGLAMTSDDRLLAHGDEYGRISVLDPRRGVILKEFSIGAKADFEGITVADGMIYMIDSDGQIYAFREGERGQRVSYVLYDTRLGRECEFEGVAFDPRRDALLLPCKNVERKDLRNRLVIYVWQLNPRVAPRLSVIAIPISRAIADNPWTTLRPSDIAVDPRTGNYVLVASSERALIELAPNGDVVRSMPLPGGAEQHPQTEGIAITEDGTLILSDEAGRRPAFITLYRWPLEPAQPIGP